MRGQRGNGMRVSVKLNEDSCSRVQADYKSQPCVILARALAYGDFFCAEFGGVRYDPQKRQPSALWRPDAAH
jgi:hypothetical protein